MIKEGKFGVSEAVCLTTITIITKVFYSSPSLLIDMLATSSWYMTLISAATAMVGFTFIYLLLKRFPGKDIVEIYKTAFGGFVGPVFSMLLALFLLLISFATIREFVDVLKVYVMPRSSANYLIIIFVSVVAILCFYGLESIARLSRASAYFLLAGLGMVLILSYQNYQLAYLFPFWGHGVSKTIVQGFMRSSSYGEVIILAIIASSLQGAKYIKRAGYISLVISGILISATLLAYTLTFPYTVGAEITSIMYELTMQIGYGRFVQRLDPIFLFVWVISSFISVSVLLYGTLSIYAKTFDIDDLRPCIMPFFIIVFCLASLPEDMVTVVSGYIQNIRSYGWTIFFVLPLIALITAIIRKKKGETANE
ncbi:MAG: endospore germination permease [Clostridiaceae bacterium]|nr:endospore germination permease [Clostridiaceae bacterium]